MSSNSMTQNDSLEEKVLLLEAALAKCKKELAAKMKHYEGKLVTMTVINGALQTENEKLKEELQQSYADSSSSSSLGAEQELKELHEEFTKRLGLAEKTASSMKEECFGLRKSVEELNKTKMELTNRIAQKDASLEQYIAEGQNLAKKLGESELTAKKLRAENVKSEAERDKLLARIQVLEAAAMSAEAAKTASLAEANETIDALRKAMVSQKEFFSQSLVEAEKRREFEVQKTVEELSNQSSACSNEMQQREQLLLNNLNAARQSLSQAEEEASGREEKLRAEILKLEGKLRLAEQSLESETMVAKITSATQPLLRQLESVSSRLAESEAESRERERQLYCQLEEQKETSNARLAALRRAEASCQAAERRAELADRMAADAKLAATAVRQRVVEGEEDRKALESEVSLLRGRLEEVEAENGRLQILVKEVQDQKKAAEKEFRLKLLEMKELLVKISEKEKELKDSREPRNGDSAAEERQVRQNPPSPSPASAIQKVPEAGLWSSGKAGGAVATERLAAKVRQQMGEIGQLQKELSLAKAERDHVSQELLEVSQKLLKMQDDGTKVQGLEKELQELQKRHDMALVIIGERNERADELEADLADVKALYREQINLLVNEIDPAKWPSGYRICLFCSHCSQIQRKNKR